MSRDLPPDVETSLDRIADALERIAPEPDDLHYSPAPTVLNPSVSIGTWCRMEADRLERDPGILSTDAGRHVIAWLRLRAEAFAPTPVPSTSDTTREESTR
jgi:hypothetical protein